MEMIKKMVDDMMVVYGVDIKVDLKKAYDINEMVSIVYNYFYYKAYWYLDSYLIGSREYFETVVNDLMK